MDLLKMYFLLNMWIFHCYLSLPEVIFIIKKFWRCISYWTCGYSIAILVYPRLFLSSKKQFAFTDIWQSEVSSLKHYSPGSIIRWPFGACGTLDFASAMTCLTQQLSAGESRGYRGVIFKVRRLLTAKEVDESNRQAGMNTLLFGSWNSDDRGQ